MDLFRILNELRSRKAEVEKLIALLERRPVEHVTITTKLLRSSHGHALAATLPVQKSASKPPPQ